VIEFGVPPTASHKNNFAKLVRANAAVVSDRCDFQMARSPVYSTVSLNECIGLFSPFELSLPKSQ
jgi:hypothetical protein